MKKFKIALCAFVVLLSGLMFAACGDKDNKLSTFNVDDILIGNKTLTYNGNSQAFSVSYAGVNDLTVSYCKTKDGKFVPASELGCVDANVDDETYSAYYKLSAKGYEPYVSTTAEEFTIQPKELNISLNDAIKDKVFYNINSSAGLLETIEVLQIDDYVDGDFDNSKLVWQFTAEDGQQVDLVEELTGDKQTLLGKEFTAKIVSVDLQNYKLAETKPQTKIVIVDNFKLTKGETVSWYNDFQTAVSNLDENATLDLYKDVTLDSSLNIAKTLTINGNGHKIAANVSDNFTNVGNKISGANGLLNVTNGKLTLTNVTLDGANAVRGIKVACEYQSSQDPAASLVLGEGTIVTNCLGTQSAGGVYVTGGASVSVDGAQLYGNTYSDEEAENGNLIYSADLWVGSQATAKMSSGYVANVWVNANSQSIERNDANLTISGGRCDSVFVEYDFVSDKSAKVKMENANVKSLMLGASKQEFVSYQNVANGTYESGIAVSALSGEETKYYRSIEQAIQDGVSSIDLLVDVHLIESLNLASDLTINGNGHKIIAEFAAAKASSALIFVDKAGESFTLTLNDVTIDGNDKIRCIYMGSGNLVLNENALVTNGRAFAGSKDEEKVNGGVYLTANAHLVLNGGAIKGNNNAKDGDKNFGDQEGGKTYYRYDYIKDLWIGANATVEVNAGEIDYVWVNANEYSQSNPEDFVQLTIKGGKLAHVCLELHQAEDKCYRGTIKFENNSKVADLVVRTGQNMFESFSNANNDTNLTFVAKRAETYYFSFLDAIKNYAADDVVTLLENVTVTSQISIPKKLTINGNAHSFVAVNDHSDFTNNPSTSYSAHIFNVFNSTLTLNNVVIDGSKIVRGVYMMGSDTRLVLDQGTIIKNCLGKDGGGAIYATKNAVIEIKNATIKEGNQYTVDAVEDLPFAQVQDYKYYSADIWASSQTKITISDGATVGKIYLSAEGEVGADAGLIVNGGTINHVFVGYAEGNGAKCQYAGGTIENLYVVDADEVAQQVTNITQQTYTGGQSYNG